MTLYLYIYFVLYILTSLKILTSLDPERRVVSDTGSSLQVITKPSSGENKKEIINVTHHKFTIIWTAFDQY